MRRRVIIPQPVHPDAVQLLGNVYEVQHAVAAQGGIDELYEGIENCDALLVRTAPLPGEIIRRAPRLCIIARHGVGVDNIDVDAATQCGIPVVITPEANAVSVAEHVLGMMIGVVRKLHEADRAVRSDNFGFRDRAKGIELMGKRLGLIGLGRVGARVAQIAKHGFAMDVAGYDPYLHETRFAELGIEQAANLDDLLASSDFVSLHLPLTGDNRHLIGRDRILRMKDGAVLINCARGGLVDEAALAEALHSGKLRAAAIDVFESEPPPADHPLFRLPNVLMSPHMAAHTEEAMRRMAVGAAERIAEVLQGKPPRDVVNPDYVHHVRF